MTFIFYLVMLFLMLAFMCGVIDMCDMRHTIKQRMFSLGITVLLFIFMFILKSYW